MRKLNNQEILELKNAYQKIDELTTYDRTSYSISLKEENSGGSICQIELNKRQLLAILRVLDPHIFFNSDSWSKNDE